jgi:predicted lipid carrier protein YhbT
MAIEMSESSIAPGRGSVHGGASQAGADAPLGLLPVQVLLGRIVRHIASRRPELFDRIGPHKAKRFLIVPTNLPYAMLLRPDPDNLVFRAVRRSLPDYDVRITGTALTLLAMIDGNADSDALFFSRDLIVEGDTEAVVCLRNALDDLDGSVADDVAGLFRLPGRIILTSLRKIRRGQRNR